MTLTSIGRRGDRCSVWKRAIPCCSRAAVRRARAVVRCPRRSQTNRQQLGLWRAHPSIMATLVVPVTVLKPKVLAHGAPWLLRHGVWYTLRPTSVSCALVCVDVCVRVSWCEKTKKTLHFTLSSNNPTLRVTPVELRSLLARPAAAMDPIGSWLLHYRQFCCAEESRRDELRLKAVSELSRVLQRLRLSQLLQQLGSR